MGTFDSTLHATAYVAMREQDAQGLRKQGVKTATGRDWGYARVATDESGTTTLSDRQGRTLAFGKNVTCNQVLALILRVFW